MTSALDQLAEAARSARPTLPTPAELREHMAAPMGIGRIFEDVLAEAIEQKPSRSFRIPEVARRP